MSIRFNCKNCYASVTAPSKAAGHFLDCPACLHRLEVPDQDDERLVWSDGGRGGRRSRLGVILAVTFLGVAVLSLVIILAVVLPKGDSAGPDILSGIGGGDIAEIQNHPFWDKPMSRATAEQLLSDILKQKRNTLIYLGSHGKWEVETGKDLASFRAAASTPDDYAIFSSRWLSSYRDQSGCRRAVLFDMMRYRKTPTREELLKDLKQVLDEAHFRG